MRIKRRYHKFGAKPITIKNVRYQSTAEGQYSLHLDLLQKAGEILFYLTQVPIKLPGGTKLVIDFLVFYVDGTVEFIDVKGRETEEFKIKKREVEAIYPFDILKVRKKEKAGKILWEFYE